MTLDEIKSYEKNEKQLKSLFLFFNELYFNNDLENVDISINLKSYINQKKPYSKKIGNNYRITLPVVLLGQNPIDIANFLLHEMIHVYTDIKGVNATSRQGTYHNKKFKECAEQCDLEVQLTETQGWSKTEIKEENKEKISEIVKKLDFAISREDYNEMLKEFKSLNAKQPRLIKYSCPTCGSNIYATKDVNIECMQCQMLFVKKPV